MKNPIEIKTWDEFRKTGLFWMINSTLHLFGWVLLLKIENENVVQVEPARTTYRGFDVESNDKGFELVTKYMADTARELLLEVNES